MPQRRSLDDVHPRLEPLWFKRNGRFDACDAAAQSRFAVQNAMHQGGGTHRHGRSGIAVLWRSPHLFSYCNKAKGF
jgi:hypothetical protein